MIEPFVAAFMLALISEIADKTQLVILGLALKYDKNAAQARNSPHSFAVHRAG